MTKEEKTIEKAKKLVSAIKTTKTATKKVAAKAVIKKPTDKKTVKEMATKAPAGVVKKMDKKSPKKTKEASNKFAVIMTGGKQYLVREGDTVKIERLKDAKKDSKITFNEVLLVVNDKDVKIGNPLVSGAKVTAKVEDEIRDKKVIVLKYKRKTRYKVKRGHRQIHTKVTILTIQ